MRGGGGERHAALTTIVLVLLIGIGEVGPPEQSKVIVPTKKTLLVEDVKLLPRGELLVADSAGEAAKMENLLPGLPDKVPR